MENGISCDIFNAEYLDLTKELISKGKHQSSRNGDTIELLNFKTEISNPLDRCVGGYGRNTNIFFLLQEAIWIWLGQKHIKPLTWFNSNMANFSDDGNVFHAPYGFRLRNYGLPSDSALFEKQNVEQSRDIGMDLPTFGMDQINTSLMMLEENPKDRRAVASIWNPSLDLGFKCKDLPCNDMLMFKVRDGKLHITIQNRSNDLHWGLPTNVFQFSFILEMMSTILGVEMGTQTHNSQSLHVYTSNPITLTMLSKEKKDNPLHSVTEPKKIDFNELKEAFGYKDRLKVVDSVLTDAYGIVCELGESFDAGKKISFESLENKLKTSGLKSRSNIICGIVKLLFVYLNYKSEDKKGDKEKYDAITTIVNRIKELEPHSDIKMLAINFFATRIKDKSELSDEYKNMDY